MISVAYTLLLLSMVFGTVPSAWAAPVGTRHLDVRSMRRMEARQLTGMRREHHSATSIVPRDDDPVAAVVARAGAPEDVKPDITAKLAKRNVRRHHAKNGDKDKDAQPRALPRFKRDAIARRERSGSRSEVVARKEDAGSSNIARKDEKVRRDVEDPPVVSRSVPPTPDLYNGAARGGGVKGGDKPDAVPRDAPVVERTESIHEEVVARSHGAHGGGDKKPCAKPDTTTPDTTTLDAKREEMKENTTKREETKPGPIKPIAIFRRALAFEDLD
ncbi:hypothetical protein FPV67DRAFT_1492595 [Lyophyllum atratum]|nr:hypothetical protein FPV67DRAFT_1492595 [Lyophyllum atratum]